MKAGILVVNKSKDMTSHDVVSILRRKLKIKRIGHTGTLDPIATGVLPICIGNATRISEYIMEQGKSYIASLKFGYSTTTYDSTGDVVDKSDKVSFTDSEILEVIDKYIGNIKQTPPIYSAIKVDGKKLYEYAREGKSVEIKSRNVDIYDIKLLENSGENIKIYVKCSKGTYIRSLIHDIGISLGTFAHMTVLIRTSVGKFDIEDSYDIDSIDNMSIDEISQALISIEDSLYNLDKINIKEDIKQRLINGQRINVKTLNNNFDDLSEDTDISVYVQNEFIGIGEINNNILKMEKVLVNSN